MDRDRWLEQAMEQWEVPLLRTCYLLVKDVALAEDAVQDTFVKAWQAHDRSAPRTKRPWRFSRQMRRSSMNWLATCWKKKPSPVKNS